MSSHLLPASAKAFAPRTAPIIVLGSKLDSWLMDRLKFTERARGPMDSVSQHRECLRTVLACHSATWTIASLMLPIRAHPKTNKRSIPLLEAMSDYHLIHVEAYIVHVDMVSQNEVAFKLTKQTIEELVDYHKQICSPVDPEDTGNLSKKEVQLKEMQEKFEQAANGFVFFTNIRALEGLDEHGAGELSEGRPDAVKSKIMNMFLSSLIPPRIDNLFCQSNLQSNFATSSN